MNYFRNVKPFTVHTVVGVYSLYSISLKSKLIPIFSWHCPFKCSMKKKKKCKKFRCYPNFKKAEKNDDICIFLFYHISSICRAPLRNTAIGLFLTGWLGDRLVHLAGGAVPWRHIAQQRLPYPALVGRGWRDGGSQVRLTLVRLSTLWAHRARTPRFSMIAKHN